MSKGNMFNLSPVASLVFDASALINIASSGICAEFIAALGRNCLVEEIAWREITGHIEKYRLNENIKKAVSCGQLDIVDMSQSEAAMYISLVSAPHPNTLDDGEAATIALAHNREAIAVIDEKKGGRIAGELVPPLNVLSTLDLFKMIEDGCQSNGLCINTALFKSLTKARMRVPFEHEDWVFQCLTGEQVKQCVCLPKRLRERAF